MTSSYLTKPSTKQPLDRSFSFSLVAMALDQTPRQPAKAYGSEGGTYYEWRPAELPMLVASIGAAKLLLAAGDMSLPSYSDSAKVAYVLQACQFNWWLRGRSLKEQRVGHHVLRPWAWLSFLPPILCLTRSSKLLLY